MSKSILLLKGQSRYNVLRKAADLVAVGFRNKGYEVRVLDLVDDEDVASLNEELTNDYSFIFSIQALLFDCTTMQNEPVVSAIKKLWFGWIVDDILYHFYRVKNNIYENTYIFSVDHCAKQIANRMFPNVTHMIPLVHGGFCLNKEIAEKDIDVLFPGTVGTRPDWNQFANNPMPIETFLVHESMKVLQAHPEISVRTAVEQVLNGVGEEMTTEVLLDLNQVIGYLETYIRYECRHKMFEAILKAGIHVHIVGEGHDALVEQYSDLVTPHGACDIDQVIDLMGRSKIIINPFPPVFEQGFHERIFSAMLCKAAIFTPYTEFAQQTMGTRLELVNMHDLSQMSSRIKEILNDYESYKDTMLEDNYLYALENHTWEKRGEQIVDFYESGCNLDWRAF